MDIIKVLIADDEEIIREGLRQAIPWQSLGFQVVGTVNNGEEGLDAVKELRPDLVITDVRMPVMDGLELSRNLSKSYPDICIIILSGYDDFQYAQNALKSGVIDYILKPVYKPDFVEILKTTKSKILARKLECSRINVLSEKAQTGESLVRDRLLLDYFSAVNRDFEKLKDSLILFGANPQFSFHTVAVIEIHPLAQIGNDTLLKRRTNNELRVFSEKYFSDRAIVFQSEDSTVGIIFSWDQYNLLEKLNSAVMAQLNIKVTIGVGNPYNNLSDIYKSYHEACQSINGKFYKGLGSIIFFREIENYKRSYIYPATREYELYDIVKSGETDSLKEAINSFFRDILSNGLIEINVVYASILKLLINMEKRTLNKHPEEDISNDLVLVSYDDVIRLETLDSAKDFVYKYLLEITEYLSHRNSGTNSSIIKKALSIMDHDCTTCTLSSVADKVFVTSSYLSLIFKLETGENFIDVLTRIRIEKSKKLLISTQLKIYEVSEKVGYQDQRYFSQIFKKITGVSPREFRESSQ